MEIAQQTIRHATDADIGRIVEMGMRFWVEGPYSDQPVQADIGARFAANLLVSSSAVILVAEEEDHLIGVIAFVLFPHFFTGILTATEMIWYVEKEHRPGGIAVKLMWEAERVAKEAGAACMTFTAPTTPVGDLYKRFGYKQVEVAYQKRL